MVTGWVRVGFFIPEPILWAHSHYPNLTCLINGFFFKNPNPPHWAPSCHDRPKITNTNTNPNANTNIEITNTNFRFMIFPFKITNTNPNTNTNMEIINTNTNLHD